MAVVVLNEVFLLISSLVCVFIFPQMTLPYNCIFFFFSVYSLKDIMLSL